MKRPLRVLNVEDSEDDSLLLRRALEQGEYDLQMERVDTAAGLNAALDRQPWDLLITDFSMPHFDGARAVAAVRERVLDLPCIIVSGTIGEETAVAALKAGAQDFLIKGKLARLLPVVERELREAEARKAHHLAERKIREQAALLDFAQDAILAINLDYVIQFWNRGATRLYGWTAEEAIGQSKLDLIFPTDELSRGQAGFAEVLARGEWTGELRQRGKDGRALVVESRWNLVPDGDGRSHSVLIVSTDITERKELEKQFLRAQRMESLGVLAGGIAHDLNNVLTPVVMAVDLLREPMPDAQRHGLLDLLGSAADRGAQLIKQILTFSRGVEGQRAPLPLRHVIRDVEKIIAHSFPKSIRIVTDIAPDLWLVEGDATQLAQVLMNLCVNARDAMPQGGHLVVRAENQVFDDDAARRHVGAKPGRYVRLAVTDTGTGIAPQILERIFDPFFTTKEHGKGTGLGLSTTRGIVKSHGGFLEVATEVGKGTQFVICLPATDSGPVTTAIIPGMKFLPHGRGELILVVDDEAAIREITHATLETAGYRVLTAADGSEAVDLLTRHRDEVRLVITDMMMPLMDGPATIRAVRQLSKDLPILAVSGLVSSDQARDSLEGAGAYLSKPYTAEEMLRGVHRLLSGRG